PVRKAVEARRHLVVEELLKLRGGDEGVIGPGRAEVQRVAFVLLVEDQPTEAAAGDGEQQERDRSGATHAARMPPCGPRSQRFSCFSSPLPRRLRISTRRRATRWLRGSCPR